jgi:hypothetical protein
MPAASWVILLVVDGLRPDGLRWVRDALWLFLPPNGGA